MSNDDGATSSEAKKMKLSTPDIKIYYPNFPFWRGEVLRAGLYLQDIPFENVTDREKIAALKEKGLNPFGALPVMEIDGQILSQTQACATYVGKLGEGKKLYPSNDDILAQANCDEIINGCTDVTTTTSATFRIEDKKTAREELIDPSTGRLYKHMKGLNAVVCKDGSEFACGSKHGMTVADLAVWKLVNWFAGGSLDHIPTNFVMSFPNLKKIYENVEKNEKIQAYKKEYYPEK